MRVLARIVLVLAAACLLLASCSTRKNTAATRNYQAFITRYNVYFNGDEHYKTTLKEMETKYEDEYSQRVYMHPAEARNNPKAPQPTGNFDRSIEKAQKAIQLHSIKKRPAKKSGKNNDPEYKAWMKREEYNPFLHNAWLMMGRSQYFNSDFAGAAATFGYIAKHFTWLPDVTTEAKLWEARSYCGMDWLFEAETILKRINPEKDLTNKTLQGLYYFTYADYYVLSGDNKQAIPMLEKAIKYAKGAQKIRLNFLLGQLYAAEGMKAEAYKAFKAAGASGASYRTQFNARIKRSEVFDGPNIESEVKALRRMARYDRNKEYLDQIYYAIGNLYLSRQDTAKAVEAYKEAIEKSTRSGFDKALVQITLGQIYFDRHQYVLAQPCYSEAVPQLPETFANYAMLKRRSDVLDELATYAGNVELQDSLLRLAAMTPEQQLEVVNAIIAELKKKEKEAEEQARREEYLSKVEGAVAVNGGTSSSPTTFTMNGDDSWYFYNTTTKNQGKTEFQRRWGSRKLEDDWRRRNKTSFNTSDFESGGDDEEHAGSGDEGASADSVADAKASDPHNPEYYLAQIPKTEEEIKNSNDIIQEGLYNMGLILKDKLEDFPAAETEWDRLLTRYPDNIYRLDVYYNMYLMYARQGDMVMAERWRRKILDDFPESKEGMALSDPDFLDNLKGMDAAQEALYEQTLTDYLDNRNNKVHAAYDYMNTTYPMSKILPKFMFLHALAYVTEDKPEEFNATLKELLERYPTTDITPLASAYLKGMAQGRELHKSAGGNMRGMIWDIRLGNDSTATGGDQPLQLELNPDAPQVIALLYPTDSVSTNALLYDVARHNFNTFVVRDFDLEPMQFGRLGVLLIRGFNNQGEANHYMRLLQEDRTLELPASVRPVILSEKDFETLLKEGRSFDEYFRATGEKTLRETHEDVLPPDEYPSAEEMYGTEEPKEEPEEKPEGEPKPEPVVEPKEAPEEKPETPKADEPAKKPVPETPKAEPKAEPKKEQPKAEPKKEQPKTEPKAEPKKEPKKEPTPKVTLPEYPAGSEGDDDE